MWWKKLAALWIRDDCALQATSRLSPSAVCYNWTERGRSHASSPRDEGDVGTVEMPPPAPLPFDAGRL